MASAGSSDSSGTGSSWGAGGHGGNPVDKLLKWSSLAKREAKKDVLVALDIGTTKICVLVGQWKSLPLEDENTDHLESQIDIIGIGQYPCHGLRKGVVINMDSTVDSISKAVAEAEAMAGVKISEVLVGIAGGHIESFNSHGVVAVKEGEISSGDIAHVLDAAKAVAIPQDREIIHVVPQEYILDDQDGIRVPLGMSGVRLQVKAHIVTGSVSSIQNIVKCCNRAGLTVSDIVLEPIASGEAVLTADERELGVVLVDIGGGTSDVAIFHQGALVHTAVIPIGGNHITRDIAVGLRAPQNEAEKLKLRYGCAMAAMVPSDQNIDVPGVGGRNPRTIARRHLAEIIEPRVEEIFTLIREEVKRAGYQDIIGSGYVFTGGATLLEGVLELGEMIFDIPVKRGYPSGVSGIGESIQSPRFSTAVGLLKFGGRKRLEQPGVKRGLLKYDQVTNSVKGWLRDLF